MSFAEQLGAGGSCPVAVEITPPQKPLPQVLLRRARLLAPLACAVNVIQRPGRQPSLDASLALRAEGIEPVWHLVTRGRPRAELAAEIERAAAGGLRQVLCILGDHAPAAPAGDAPPIREVVAMAAAAMPGAVLGATFNQYAPDRAAALRNLVPKLAAGASYVQAQPVFDVAALAGAIAPVRAAAPRVRVVPMVMPLLDGEAALKIEARLGVTLPRELHERVAASPESAWALFDETVARLLSEDLADGLAVMTFETDPPPETGARILAALRAAGAG